MGKIDDIYKAYKTNIEGIITDDKYFEHFINMAKSGERKLGLSERYIDQRIDIKWVQAIEECIIPLDNIIRNPNKFIRRDEEVVPIEMARNVDVESIKHLAQHTNYIVDVQGDQVTPNKILNTYKEESLETYENRFIFTLLKNLQYFLDKRLQVLLTKGKGFNEFALVYENNFKVGSDTVTYKMEITSSSPRIEQIADAEVLLQLDTSKLNAMQRIERIRKILYDFQSTHLITSLKGCNLIRPPLTMTNVLTKNQDFVKAVELWAFIETYKDEGYTLDLVDKTRLPDRDYCDDLDVALATEYVLLKNYTHGFNETVDIEETRKRIEPKMVKKTIEQLMSEFNLEISDVKRVFIDEINRVNKKLSAEERKVKNIIDRAIKTEKEKRAIRLKKIKDKERLLKEKEKIRKEKEKLRIQKKKELEKKRKEKEKLLKKKSQTDNKKSA